MNPTRVPIAANLIETVIKSTTKMANRIATIGSGSWSTNWLLTAPSLKTYCKTTLRSLLKARVLLDAAYLASKDLCLIGPKNGSAHADHILAARQAIFDAECVYILGSGFDENKSKLLGLFDSLRFADDAGPAIMFTNYGNRNRVSRALA